MAGIDIPPAILLGGATNALSAARSLGQRGICVHALAESARTQAVRWSRHTSQYVAFPGGSVQAWWREWLAHSRDGAVVLPTSDNGLEFIARNRAFLLDLGYHPVEANDELLLAMLDKGATYQVATAAGIDAPRAVRIQSLEELRTQHLRLPCVVKPTTSHRRSSGFGNRKALLVQDQCELERTVRATTDGEAGVVVTEVVPGPDDSFCSYYTYLVNGEPLFHYTKRKLRQYPIHFGDGSYHESEDVPEARELGLRLFRAAGLIGLGNVEFKRDERDGKLKLIECNLRLTAADPMIRAGGLDLPSLLYERALGRPGPPLGPYQRRTRQWEPSRDIRAFVAYRRARELTTRDWLRTVIQRNCLPLFSLSDPAPSIGNALASPHRLTSLVRRSIIAAHNAEGPIPSTTVLRPTEYQTPRRKPTRATGHRGRMTWRGAHAYTVADGSPPRCSCAICANTESRVRCSRIPGTTVGNSSSNGSGTKSATGLRGTSGIALVRLRPAATTVTRFIAIATSSLLRARSRRRT